MALDQRELSPLIDELPSRYVVGIDLGTTNSAVTYVDTGEDPWQVRVFSVPQLVAPSQVEARETLPSFYYQAAGGEMAGGALRLPWSTADPAYAVGVYARDEGTRTPGRSIASAKSWLCHSGVDRTAELLPWQGAADVDRLSPVEVSARYLRHVHEAWNACFPGASLSEQEVVLTLPASFDEVARELTVQAAARADLPRIVLIEEPLAAFYAWVNLHAHDWHQLVEPGQKILVCDIGGGTSDFTLIRVRRSEASEGDTSKVQFHRVAVGDHLILGGDNLDLALAEHLERNAADGKKLAPQQWDVLVRSCRRVKEELLSEDGPEERTVHLPASGSRVIGGGIQIRISRREVRELLVEGFLPRVRLDDVPDRRQSGFQEFGLPYAADPAITRYVAAFLTAHRDVALESGEGGDHDPARPDVVLFNGGFFASPLLRDRLLDVLRSWFPAGTGGPWNPRVLENDRLDLAVAKGAAYYGMVRRGAGVRVAANLARSYYIGIESEAPTAVCLVPGSAEPGQDYAAGGQPFELTISEPVEFPLFVSSTRLVDAPGSLVPVDDESMHPLPPIRTVLKTRRRSERGTVPVQLHARLTEIGTMDLWCTQVDTDRRWRLQFDVRAATRTDVEAHPTQAESEGFLDESVWEACYQRLSEVFGENGRESPDGLIKRLARALDGSRSSWPPSLLRRMWESLIEMESGRRRSGVHEARWINLLGYALRPGYGLAMDDWRVAETWRAVHNKLSYSTSSHESHVLWRRLAGGLSRGQQVTVAERLLAQVRAMHLRHANKKKKQVDVLMKPQETVEAWRLLGSLELLPVTIKVELGNMIVDLLTIKKLQKTHAAMTWALGRLGQRVPLYGPFNTVVSVPQATAWLDTLLARDGDDRVVQLAIMQLARRTHDRHRDIPESLRQEIVEWLEHRQTAGHLIELVARRGSLDAEEQSLIIGEALPKGLRVGRMKDEG
ncbi:MAG: Hsp70 family protein [Pirellulaceae bacterium]